MTKKYYNSLVKCKSCCNGGEVKMMRDLFPTGDTAKITGVSVRQLQYWDNIKLIPAYTRDKSGREYTLTEMVIIKTARMLLDAGLPLHQLKIVASYLREQFKENNPHPDNLKQTVLLTDGTVILELVTTHEKLLEILSGNAISLFAVDIGDVAQKVLTEIFRIEELRHRLLYHDDFKTDEMGKEAEANDLVSK